MVSSTCESLALGSIIATWAGWPMAVDCLERSGIAEACTSCRASRMSATKSTPKTSAAERLQMPAAPKKHASKTCSESKFKQTSISKAA
eukprot:scaffold394966_cov34-Prasinocladus_malaysianus.AAC.1